MGSREYPDKDTVVQVVIGLPKDTIIVSGGARGVDSWARETAREHGYEYEEYPANWKVHGKAAGMIRNRQLVAACDHVIIFWDGESRGTKNTIDLCVKMGRPHQIHIPNGSKALAGIKALAERYENTEQSTLNVEVVGDDEYDSGVTQ